MSYCIIHNIRQLIPTLWNSWNLILEISSTPPGGMSFNWLFTYIYPEKNINTSPSIGIFTCKPLSPFSSWSGGCVLSQIFLHEVDLWVVVLLRALLCLLVCHAFCYDSCVSAFQGHWIIWSLFARVHASPCSLGEVYQHSTLPSWVTYSDSFSNEYSSSEDISSTPQLSLLAKSHWRDANITNILKISHVRRPSGLVSALTICDRFAGYFQIKWGAALIVSRPVGGWRGDVGYDRITCAANLPVIGLSRPFLPDFTTPNITFEAHVIFLCHSGPEKMVKKILRPEISS